MNTVWIKRQLIKTGKALDKDGLIMGGGGNISALSGDVIYIKRKGVAMAKAGMSGYVAVSLKTGKPVRENEIPSTEIYMHLACYKNRKDIGAVVHTHPPFATAVAISGARPGILSYEMAVYVNSEVGRIGYVAPGTTALGRAIGKAVKKHNAILLKNHGLITVGKDLDEAYFRSLAMERACTTFVACKLIDKVKNIRKSDVARWMMK